jgi:hypothetical protein
MTRIVILLAFLAAFAPVSPDMYGAKKQRNKNRVKELFVSLLAQRRRI